MEDALDRLKHLCHVGSLAIDGLHGLGEDPAATALASYFDVLVERVDMIRELSPAVQRASAVDAIRDPSPPRQRARVNGG
jgi:hypothetical protein